MADVCTRSPRGLIAACQDASQRSRDGLLLNRSDRDVKRKAF